MKKQKGGKGRRLREGEWGEGREEENRKEGRKGGREGHTRTKFVPRYIEKYFICIIIVKQGFLSLIVHNYLLLQI